MSAHPAKRPASAGPGVGTAAATAGLTAVVLLLAGCSSTAKHTSPTSPFPTSASAASTASASPATSATSATRSATSTAHATPTRQTTPITPATQATPTMPKAAAVPSDSAQEPADVAPGMLKAPSGNYYQAGEFCPKKDLGMSTTDGNGHTLTCVSESGGYHWRD
ncbi:hypothetical protein GXW82_41805 [Streptacidiphilus sp. 4-A2]|nr:hypothetical protein [Streptacidiphilus sp. 4-A2]